MMNFRFDPKNFAGVILLIESKLTTPNGSCAQDAAGKGVADECWHTATHCNNSYTATHCNTLQHTAIHCDTLQYTATDLRHQCRHLLVCFAVCPRERWGAGVETQKNVLGEIGGWGRVPFNEPYAPSLSTIYDGA